MVNIPFVTLLVPMPYVAPPLGAVFASALQASIGNVYFSCLTLLGVLSLT